MNRIHEFLDGNNDRHSIHNSLPNAIFQLILFDIPKHYVYFTWRWRHYTAPHPWEHLQKIILLSVIQLELNSKSSHVFSYHQQLRRNVSEVDLLEMLP